MLSDEIPLGLYIHIPWCIKKCPYCDFNSHASQGELPELRYVKSLLKDLEFDITRFKESRKIQHIFIGGGTPSLFSANALKQLLQGIAERVVLAKNSEITLEANPGAFESEQFHAYREAGVNRLSIGIQSFDEASLKRLGRVHSAIEAERAIAIAKQAGFDNFNLDLMFGLPEAKTDLSYRDIQIALSFAPAHLSFYQLTLEPNTLFHKHPPRLPEQDAIVEEQLRCQQLLANNGFQQYEISAYAKHNKQCKHNLNYWQFGDYLGIGAGAHGKISRELPKQIIRYSKIKSPDTYMLRLSEAGKTHIATEQCIAEVDMPLEFMMNQLRLKNGFRSQLFEQKTGLSLQKIAIPLQSCIHDGLLRQQGDWISCTERGWTFLDSVVERFIASA